MARKLRRSELETQTGAGLIRLGKARVDVFSFLEDQFEDAKAGKNSPESCRAIAFKVVAFSLMLGRQPPEWAAESFLDAADEYLTFRAASLSDAFQAPARKHLAAKRDELKCWQISEALDRLKNEGVPLVGTKERDGAYTVVGRTHNMSAKKVEALAKKWRDIFEKGGKEALVHQICAFEICSVPRKTRKT